MESSLASYAHNMSKYPEILCRRFYAQKGFWFYLVLSISLSYTSNSDILVILYRHIEINSISRCEGGRPWSCKLICSKKRIRCKGECIWSEDWEAYGKNIYKFTSRNSMKLPNIISSARAWMCQLPCQWVGSWSNHASKAWMIANISHPQRLNPGEQVMSKFVVCVTNLTLTCLGNHWQIKSVDRALVLKYWPNVLWSDSPIVALIHPHTNGLARIPIPILLPGSDLLFIFLWIDKRWFT